MEEIVFVTHNKGKIASAQRQLAGVNVKQRKSNYKK